MALKRVAEPNHAARPRDTECLIIESTAAAQASATIVPGNQRDEGDGCGVEIRRRTPCSRFRNAERTGPQRESRPVLCELQPIVDNTRQVNALAARPCALDQSRRRELMFRRNVGEDRLRVPKEREIRQRLRQSELRGGALGKRQTAPLLAHLPSNLWFGAPHPDPLRDGQRQSVSGYAVWNESDGLGTDRKTTSTMARCGCTVGLPPSGLLAILVQFPESISIRWCNSAPHPANLTDLS